jgi:hypothetical protein
MLYGIFLVIAVGVLLFGFIRGRFGVVAFGALLVSVVAAAILGAVVARDPAKHHGPQPDEPVASTEVAHAMSGLDSDSAESTMEERVNRYLAEYDSLLALKNAVYGRDSLAVEVGVYNRCGYALLDAISVIDSAATSGGFPDFVHLADLARGRWAGRFHEYEKYRAMEQPNHDGRNCERLNELNTAYVRVLELGYGSYRRSH